MKILYSLVCLIPLLNGCKLNSSEIEKLQEEINDLKQQLSECSNQPTEVSVNKTLQSAQLNIAGKSYGGVLRESPNKNSPKIKSLKLGDELIIIGRTEEYLFDYPWFKVELKSGEVGYTWGGILCAFGDDDNVGTYRHCRDF